MEKIAIVGCGLIGRAWSMVFARAGHGVKLYDVVPGVVDTAMPLIREGLCELQRAGLLREAPDTIMQRISPVASLREAVGDADYVQESTAEKVEVKRQIFGMLDAAAPPGCVLASSTSTIQTSQFTSSLPGRDRCLVAHPVNPPHVVPLVEISPAPWTSAEVLARTRALHEKIGQVPITVRKEVEGFILNRLQGALLLEAWRLVKEDYASVQDIDKCVKDGLALRWSFMGPFETIDLNAPGGVADYARRYGRLMYAMLKDARPPEIDDPLITKVEEQCRQTMSHAAHAGRESWRDRRLMALVAHKRAAEAGELPPLASQDSR